MTGPSSPKKNFLSALLAIQEQPVIALSVLESEFKATLLSFGSETEDNKACTERIGIQEAPYDHRGRAVGLALKSGPILVSHILNIAEGSKVPTEICQEFPHFQQADWDAILRLVTLIMIALEANPIIDEATESPCQT